MTRDEEIKYRDNLSARYGEEIKLVEKKFEEYEKKMREAFETPYDSYIEHIGKPFKVIRRLNEADVELEELPMWLIEIDGEQFSAYPDEIINL